MEHVTKLNLIAKSLLPSSAEGPKKTQLDKFKDFCDAKDFGPAFINFMLNDIKEVLVAQPKVNNGVPEILRECIMTELFVSNPVDGVKLAILNALYLVKSGLSERLSVSFCFCNTQSLQTKWSLHSHTSFSKILKVLLEELRMCPQS